MAIIKTTKYMIIHRPTQTVMNDTPHWHSYEPGGNYRRGNLDAERHFSKKVWAGSDHGDYLSFQDIFANGLTPKQAQRLRTYKHKGRPLSIIKKFDEYAQLYKTYPRTDESKWYQTSPSKTNADIKFVSELEIAEVTVEKDTDEVVEFKSGVNKIEQFTSGKSNYVCWSCGMKMKKLPGFLLRKPQSSIRMYLCPICAQGIAEAGKSMIESMGNEFVEKVRKQLFIKKITEL